MGPTSTVVLIAVLLASVALIVAVGSVRRVALKVTAGALALVVTLFSGAIIVNDFFAYYTSWGAAVADLTGGGNTYALTAASAELHRDKLVYGRLLKLRLAGGTSGITRTGLVYLPPQYGESRYRSERFPVIELLHGTPGDPSVWVNVLHVTQIYSRLLEQHHMGPVVLVMPDSNGGLRGHAECLNTPSNQDDTYLTTDVVSDIRKNLRVSTDPAQWGLLGFSSGGYCAANLALRHRGEFGAAAMIDGYYRPTDGPAAAQLWYQPAAEAANDPLRAARSLRQGDVPLPALWVAAGTGNRGDYQAAQAFLAAIRRLEGVPFFVEKGAHHTASADVGALPAALSWSWQQLASPDQRVRFPVVGRSSTTWAIVSPNHPLTAHVVGSARQDH